MKVYIVLAGHDGMYGTDDLKSSVYYVCECKIKAQKLVCNEILEYISECMNNSDGSVDDIFLKEINIIESLINQFQYEKAIETYDSWDHYSEYRFFSVIEKTLE